MFYKQFSNLIYKPYIFNINKWIFAWENKIPNKNLAPYIYIHTHTHKTLIDHTQKRMKFCHLQQYGWILKYYVMWNKSDRKRQITYYLTHIRNVKTKYEINKSKFADKETRLVVTRWKVGWGCGRNDWKRSAVWWWMATRIVVLATLSPFVTDVGL